jgi:adenosylhomocysteine nucleosidase
VTRPALILTGVETEARALARGLGLARLDLPFPAFGHERGRVAAIGPGAGLLETRLASLASGLASPLLVSAGLCGALHPSLPLRELVVPEAVLEGKTRHRVVERLPGREARGEILASSAIVATPEAKARLFAETGALAVDMESLAILEAARRRGWPALVVRAVSDRADETLPPALLGAVDAAGRVLPLRAFLALVRSGKLLRALALRRDTAAGLAAVADALRPLIA